MIITFLLSLYTLFIILLILFIFFPLRSNKSTNENSTQSPILPNISIVIPFRNESVHLETLISSLDLQQYPGVFEIILVDDNSTDHSVDIIRRYISRSNHNIEIIPLKLDSNLHLTSKQQAIDVGIQHAKYDYIVLTDADMHYNSNWLCSLAKQVDTDTTLVFGHTAIDKKENNFFTFLQSFQLEFLFSIAYALSKAGITGSCMGNNLLISRSEYLAIGGQKSVGYSIVEDRALFSQFKKNKKKCISTEPFTADAFTYPCQKFSQFYHQIQRWAKGGLSTGSNLLPIALLFAFQNVVLITSPFFSNTAFMLSFFNFFCTWSLIGICFHKIKSNDNALFFPLYYLFLLFESIIFVTSMFSFSKIQWKGRTLHK